MIAAERRIGIREQASRASQRRQLRAALYALLALLLYLAASLLLFRRAWQSPATQSMGFYNDPQQFMWFLGWTAFALGHHHSPFFSTYLNYPGGVNLLWNTSVLLPGALLAPVTLRWGPVFSYNLLVTLALPLSGWCAYLAFTRIVYSRLAAAVGGLLYGFSPYMTAQALAHPHLIVALAPPLVLLLLHDLLVRRRWPAMLTGAALGVVMAAQLLTGEELLATTALAAALGPLLAVLAAGRARLPTTSHDGHAGGVSIRLQPAWCCRVPSGCRLQPQARGAIPLLRATTIAAAVFLLLSAAPLLAQFTGPQRVDGALHGGRPYVADLLGFVVPGRMQWLAPDAALRLSARFNASISEQDAYLGLPLLALLIYIVARWWSYLAVYWAGLLAAGMALLALGGHLEVAGRVTAIPLPWLLVAHLPLFGNVITGRLTIFVYLLAGLLLALFLDRPRDLAPWRRYGGLVLVVLALLPLLPRPDYPVSAKVAPPFFSGAALTRIPAGSVALVAPFAALSRGTYANASSAMLWQSIAGLRFRMPEGYVFVPRCAHCRQAALAPPPSATQSVLTAILQGRPAPPWSASLRRQIMRDLRRWRVQTVIAGPMPHQARLLALFRRLFGHEPDYDGGVYVWWQLR